MQIFVKLLSGKTITFDVQSTDTIAAVKQRIKEKEGMEPSQQRLVYSGNNLEDQRTVGDYDIPKEATIYLINSSSTAGSQVIHPAPGYAAPPAPVAPATIQVTVITSAKDRFVFQVDPRATADALAQMVTDRMAMQGVTLYLGQHKLDSHTSLAGQGVTNGTILQTVVGVKGG